MKYLPPFLLLFFINLFYSSSAFACTIGVDCPGDSTSTTPKNFFDIPNLSPFKNLSGFINALISLAFFVAGIFFFFNLVIGGIQWINAGGDPKAMTSSRARITNAFIGLIIVVAAYAITALVGSIFGISIVGGFRFKTP